MNCKFDTSKAIEEFRKLQEAERESARELATAKLPMQKAMAIKKTASVGFTSMLLNRQYRLASRAKRDGSHPPKKTRNQKGRR